MPSDAAKPNPLDGLDRVLHERARLGIMTQLLAHPDGRVFNDIKTACDLTDGNLSRHLTTLQDAGLVEIWKGTKDRRPCTLVRLTADGRRRFLDYLTLLEGIVSNALKAADGTDRRPGLGFAPAG